jgi:hypothetical protein
MSPLKVYGTPMSRAARTLWMCRELSATPGVDDWLTRCLSRPAFSAGDQQAGQ